MKFSFDMASCIGSRPINEDYMGYRKKDGRFFFALADGLGGCSHGEFASLLAVENSLDAFGQTESYANLLDIAMNRAQKAVIDAQAEYPEANDMNSTLALLLLSGGFAQWAHIGDTRVYFFRRGKIEKRTVDHSVTEMLHAIGEVQTKEIRHHSERSRLLGAVGRDWSEQSYSLSERIRVMPGDAFLLCTDGFWENVLDTEMLLTLRRTTHARSWLQAMLKIVEASGSAEEEMDNYSAVCIRMKSEEPKTEIHRSGIGKAAEKEKAENQGKRGLLKGKTPTPDIPKTLAIDPVDPPEEKQE